MGLIIDEKRTYLSISGGKIRQRVAEGTPGAIKREVVNPQTAEKKVVWERVFKSFTGKIFHVAIKDSTFGQRLVLGIEDGPDRYYIDMNLRSVYALDILRRLPGIDFSKYLEISPYDFKTIEGGKEYSRKGVALYMLEGLQKVKVENYFCKSVGEGANRTTTYLYGYPQRPTKELGKEDYEMFKLGIVKFLKEYFIENIQPNFGSTQQGFGNGAADPFGEYSEGETEDHIADETSDLPF